MNRNRADSLIGLAVVTCIVCLIGAAGISRRGSERRPEIPAATSTPVEPRRTTPRHPVQADSPPVKLSAVGLEARLSEYVKLSYPKGSIEYRLGEPRIERKVSSTLRRKIIRRDGGYCVICGNGEPLEVDHMRALMNGGDNSEANLACLCHTCNASRKKSIDNSIRRQRDKTLQRR